MTNADDGADTTPSTTTEDVSTPPDTTEGKVATAAEIQPPPAKESPNTEIDIETIALKWGLTIHPAAALFPMFDEEEMAALVQDIKDHGLQHAIVRYQGQILDGRNRAKACRLAGVELKFVEYEGDTPVAYVMSANHKRRHLDKSQRSTVAVDIAPMYEAEAAKRQKGGVSVKVGEGGKTLQKAAKAMNVSTAYAEKAKKIKVASPEKFAAIKAGKKKVSQAERELKQEAKVTQIDEETLPPSAAPSGKKKRSVKKPKGQVVVNPTPCVSPKKYVLVIIAKGKDEWMNLQEEFENQINGYEDKTFAFGPDEDLDMAKGREFIDAVAAYDSATDSSPVTQGVL